MKLPLPRLQITWERVGQSCDYEVSYDLLVPIDEYDIRNEKKLGYLKLPMSGGTKVNSSRGPILQDGVLDAPFRDGAHAGWDSVALGVPAFVVYGDVARRIGSHEINQAPAPEVMRRQVSR